MDTLALIIGGVSLYLYLEVWTIRICLRYSGWLVAWVLLVDHLLLTFSLFPGYLFWKLWFIWTAFRAEPVRGLLWVPQLELNRRRRSRGRTLLQRLMMSSATSLGLLFLGAALSSGEPQALLGALALALLLPAVILALRWLWGTLYRLFGPQKSFPEPLPWDRGPATW